MKIEKCYHPEYGGYVYQPRVKEIDAFIEPYVTEKEAKAFLNGVKHMQRQQEKNDGSKNK